MVAISPYTYTTTLFSANCSQACDTHSGKFCFLLTRVKTNLPLHLFELHKEQAKPLVLPQRLSANNSQLLTWVK